MKRSRKGPLIIILFLVLVPVLVDLMFFTREDLPNQGGFFMSRLMANGYLHLLPWFLVYLCVAIAILVIINRFRKNQNKPDE